MNIDICVRAAVVGSYEIPCLLIRDDGPIKIAVVQVNDLAGHPLISTTAHEFTCSEANGVITADVPVQARQSVETPQVSDTAHIQVNQATSLLTVSVPKAGISLSGSVGTDKMQVRLTPGPAAA